MMMDTNLEMIMLTLKRVGIVLVKLAKGYITLIVKEIVKIVVITTKELFLEPQDKIIIKQ